MAKIIIIFNEKAIYVPEIYHIPLPDGFLTLWEITENLLFFENSLNESIVSTVRNCVDNEKRIKEKLIPHFVLNKYVPHVQLNNSERKPSCSAGYISISHSKQLLAIYYRKNTKTGIDIEHFGSRILKIRHKFMNATELNYTQLNIEKNLVVWAAKEALFKQVGSETAFFAEKVHVDAFDLNTNSCKLNVQYLVDTIEKTQVMNCELFDEYVLVYTV